MDSAITPSDLNESGTFLKLCAASVCTAISPAIFTISAIGWIAPVSLFACMTEINAISDPRLETNARRKSRSTTPSLVTGA